MGPVVGCIGSMQALEAIKILTHTGSSLSGRMFIYDGLDFQTRVIKLRARQVHACEMCKFVVCESLNLMSEEKCRKKLNEFDYEFFCGLNGTNANRSYTDKSVSVNLLDPATQRVTCDEFARVFNWESDLLIDVRPECQFKICSLPHSLSNYIYLFYKMFLKLYLIKYSSYS